MKTTSTHAFSVLNIVTHPHSSRKYAELFETAMKFRPRPVKVRGDQYGMVASCFRVRPSDPTSPLEGEMFRFTEIDLGEAWFNVLSANVATEDDLKNIKIPPHLRPN